MEFCPASSYPPRRNSMTDKTKPSAMETVKLESNYLRGQIGPELVDENPFFGKDSEALLKTHGTYQQDDRDARSAMRAAGSGKKGDKAYIFMVRTKIPGGKLTS